VVENEANSYGFFSVLAVTTTVPDNRPPEYVMLVIFEKGRRAVTEPIEGLKQMKFCETY
jgi:hypothetical protein